MLTGTETEVGKNAVPPKAEKRPLRVLHVISGLGLGGAERVLLDMIRLMQGRDVEFKLAVLRGQLEFPQRLTLTEKPVFLDHEGGVGNIRATMRSLRRLRGVMRQFQPDILHTHLWPADVIGALAILGRGIWHVSHQHGTNPTLARRDLRGWLKRMLTRWLFHATQAEFIAVSEAVKRYVEQVFAVHDGRVRVVYNGVDVERFANSASTGSRSNGELVIGTAARFAPEKGLDRLLRAVAVLRGDGIDLELRVAGDGSLKSDLEQLAASLEIAGAVSFVGLVSDMKQFYEGLDVFVLPSLSEGFSLALLEAMAVGNAIVATDVGGASEAVRDSVDGLIVPAGDTLALAQSLKVLALDPALRGKMATSARARARGLFTSQQMADSVYSMYWGLAAK